MAARRAPRARATKKRRPIATGRFRLSVSARALAVVAAHPLAYARALGAHTRRAVEALVLGKPFYESFGTIGGRPILIASEFASRRTFVMVEGDDPMFDRRRRSLSRRLKITRRRKARP